MTKAQEKYLNENYLTTDIQILAEETGLSVASVKKFIASKKEEVKSKPKVTPVTPYIQNKDGSGKGGVAIINGTSESISESNKPINDTAKEVPDYIFVPHKDKKWY